MGKLYQKAAVCCGILTASMYPAASAWMEDLPADTGTVQQDNTSYTLTPVTVTATKLAENVKTLPADMTVITAQQIKDMNAQSLDDVLRVVPGVQLLSYGASNMDQNLDGIRINGSKDIILLIDGVKVSDLMGAGQGGYIFASMIKNMNSIERVEVLRNGGTVLYGSGAKGGVINIITKKKFENSNSVSVSTGSYQSTNYKITSQGNRGKLNYQFYFNRYIRGNDIKDAHGFLWPGKEHQSAYGISLNYAPNDKDTFHLMANANTNHFTNYDWWYDENVTDGKYHSVDFTFSYDHAFSERWKNTMSFRNNMVETKGGMDTGVNLWYGRYSYQFLTDTLTYQSDRYQAAFGVEHSFMKPRNQKSSSYQLSIPIDDPPDPFWGPFERQVTVSVENLEMENTSVFWNNTFKISPKIELTAGVRYDHPNYLGRYTSETEAEMTTDENKAYYGYGLPNFASHTSKAFKMTFYPNKKDTFYVGRSDFFVLPSISQLDDSQFGNINLKPSQGWSSEIGYIHAFNNEENSYMTFNLWNRKGKNAIGMDSDGDWINYGSENAAGWNLQVFKQIGSNTQISVGWSQFLHDNIPQDNQYYGADNFTKGYAPRTVLTWMIDHRISKLDLTLDGRYFVRQKYVNHYGDYPGWPSNRYAVTNLSVNYSPNKQTRVTFKINNLLDAWYGEMTQAAWGGRDEFYTMPGRNYTLSVEYNF